VPQVTTPQAEVLQACSVVSLERCELAASRACSKLGTLGAYNAYSKLGMPGACNVGNL